MDGLCGVAVSGHYVYTYVAEQDHTVSVFTTDGEYVTKFGQRVTDINPFSRTSYGVCVDKDGFVYVCNQYNGGSIYVY